MKENCERCLEFRVGSGLCQNTHKVYGNAKDIGALHALMHLVGNNVDVPHEVIYDVKEDEEN
jgi:hypothetical protein